MIISDIVLRAEINMWPKNFDYYKLLYIIKQFLLNGNYNIP